jgi:hypothetical protein
MNFDNQKFIRNVAGRLVLFPYNYPRTTLALIGGAILSKVVSNMANVATGASAVVNVNKQTEQNDLLRQLIANTSSTPAQQPSIDVSDLLNR